MTLSDKPDVPPDTPDQVHVELGDIISKGDEAWKNGQTHQEDEPSKEQEAWAKMKAQLGDSKKWKELNSREKWERVMWGVIKTLTLLLLLYIFVCSLDLLSRSMQLLSGRATGGIFESELMSNPVVGLMIGILATVLVQSSSTSTSIIVSMVAADIIPIETAIPIVMGANVGTSVTNTIVAITRIGNRAEFGRAFAGATVHDMFNWLTVIVLLTLEVTTGYLYHLTGAIMDSFNFESTDTEIKTLQVITDPVCDAILLLDEDVLNGWATGNSSYDNATLLKIYCDDNSTVVLDKCPSLWSLIAWDDVTTGAIMTVLSLVILCSCLILLVKLLQNVLSGSMASVIKKTVNADIPYVPWLTGYLAMVVGAVATFLMQSSSVFTSALTPLVGMGIITVARTYPLTLGSNIGTTTTAMLAALTAPADKLHDTLQIAFCHLFFNLTGILIFYPIPFMRWPIPLAKGMGRTTAKYRWFAVAYLLFAFLLIPILVLGLSVADPTGWALISVGIVALVIIVFVVNINLMQKRVPNILPSVLRTWDWLPLFLRSLEPTDRLLTKIGSMCRKKKPDLEGEDNQAFQQEMRDME